MVNLWYGKNYPVFELYPIDKGEEWKFEVQIFDIKDKTVTDGYMIKYKEEEYVKYVKNILQTMFGNDVYIESFINTNTRPYFPNKIKKETQIPEMLDILKDEYFDIYTPNYLKIRVNIKETVLPKKEDYTEYKEELRKFLNKIADVMIKNKIAMINFDVRIVKEQEYENGREFQGVYDSYGLVDGEVWVKYFVNDETSLTIRYEDETKGFETLVNIR